MGKYISGILKCEIQFDNVYVDDEESEIDVLFHDGWEGEMLEQNLIITEEYRYED